MKCAGTGYLTLDSYLRAGKTVVDRHAQANIYSNRPNGINRNRLKWEIPDGGLGLARRTTIRACTPLGGRAVVTTKSKPDGG